MKHSLVCFSNPARILFTLLIGLTQLVVIVQPEIIELDIFIDASSDEVHFVRGFLQAPASIDLSDIVFMTAQEPDFDFGDDTYDNQYTDDYVMDDDNQGTEVPTEDNSINGGDEVVPTPSPQQSNPPGDGGESSVPAPTGSESLPPATEPVPAPIDNNDGTEGVPTVTTSAPVNNNTGNTEDVPSAETAAPATGNETTPAASEPPVAAATGAPSGNGGDRRRGLSHLPRWLEEGQAQVGTQIMDIVLFIVPQDCKKDSWGTCDWAKLGVGAYDEEMEGGMSYCCTTDTAGRKLCNPSDVGKLIVDHSIFKGDHRKVEVPSSPNKEFVMDDPVFDIKLTGDYVMVIANCNDYGLEVLALGNMEWKSVGGYLPGEMFGLMFFYAVLAAVYFVLALWYYCGMRAFQDAAIPIQKYILATILIGFVEVAFLGIDLYAWNVRGLRSNVLVYTGMTLGVLKRASSRCLAVMVSMGWGVVRDSLGPTLLKIIFLGLLYSGVTLTRDFFAVIAIEDVEKISMSEEEELIDLALLLTLIVFFINMVFYIWIITSLNSTTEYLRNMNQTSKLRRHMRLKCLIITSLLVVALWLVLQISQAFTNFMTEDQMWIMEAVMHGNYLFVLVGVSILWRPNSNAKDYAMQMELPALGGEENELELSCVVPSADDMAYDDGNDPDHVNGVRVDNGIAT